MSTTADMPLATHTCCVHSENPLETASSGLLSVALLAEDMKEFVIDLKGTEEDVARKLDATSSRLKMAQYIAKVLSERVNELTVALNSIKTGTKDATESQSTPEQAPPPPQPRNEGKPMRPAPLVRRHTTMSVPTTQETTTGGWEDRAAAFMMKRRSQQTQQVDRNAGELPQMSPPLSPTNTRFIPPSRRSIHSSDHHPQLQRLTPDQNNSESQDILWEFERRKQNPRRGMLIAAAFETYQEGWDDLTARITENQVQPHLTFATFPWPVLRLSHDKPFTEPNDLMVDDIREFLLSPFHSTDKGKESRIREAYVRFHPDKNSRWLAFVLESERERIKRGMDRVNWCLGNLK